MTFLLANWRLIVEAFIIVLAAIFFGLWQHSSAKLAQVEAAGEYAEQEKERIERQYQRTFKETQDAYAIAIPTIRDNAVAEYRKRYPVRVCDAGQVPMPGPAKRPEGTDAAGPQFVADKQFIRDCAQDAATLTLWQELARKNNFRIE